MAWQFPECDWSPRKVLRSIRPVLSSTEVVHVELDLGEAFLKGMGNPQGDECLAFELIGTRLARLAGLFVPDYAVIDRGILELTRISGNKVEDGPAFVSKFLPGSPGGGGAFLKNIVNSIDVPLVVAFDTWLCNADRYPPFDALDLSPNWDNIFFVPLSGGGYQMAVYDHTHCFSETTLEDALLHRHFELDRRVYGAFPEFSEMLSEEALRRACRSIRAIDAETIEGVVQAIPDPWGGTHATRREWSTQIINRQLSLEKILMEGLIPQRLMEFG